MKKKLTAFHAALRNNHEAKKLAMSIQKELLNRNLMPLTAWPRVGKSDIAEEYAALRQIVEAELEQTDLEDEACLKGTAVYSGLHFAVWSAKLETPLNRETLVHLAIVDLVGDYRPDIDEYIAHMGDTQLLDRLGIVADKNKLVTISGSGYELRKHGLIISPDIMVYPHQFMRRFFSANFVDLLVLLSKCVEDGYTVKLRIDPLRQTHPKYYQNIFEADYWYGQPFNHALLASANKSPRRTVHMTSGGFDLGHPVSYTVFRTWMKGDAERNFSVEEYTPTIDPHGTARRPPGFGKQLCVQKFAHMIYNQRTGLFSHIDGAVRVFGIAEYEHILNGVATGTDPGAKVGTRYKLFLVEGKIGLKLVKDILYEYFMYNPHIAEYFA